MFENWCYMPIFFERHRVFLGEKKSIFFSRNFWVKNNYFLYYYLRGLDSLFFWFKNVPTPLYLSRDKTKGQSNKNRTLTPNKT